jgi:hypothetical protein
MEANFKVGDRVRRIAGDTEAGTIVTIRGERVLVNFERFGGIVQSFVSVRGLEPFRVGEDKKGMGQTENPGHC